MTFLNCRKLFQHPSKAIVGCFSFLKCKSTLPLLFCGIVILSGSAHSSLAQGVQKDILGLENNNHSFKIDPSNGSFWILDQDRKEVLRKHPISGILIGEVGQKVSDAHLLESHKTGEDQLDVKVKNGAGLVLHGRIVLSDHYLHIKIWDADPSQKVNAAIRSASMSPVYGLGDYGGYEGKTNIFGYSNEHFINDKTKSHNWNHYRFVSTFAVFPAHGLAQVVFGKGEKSVTINQQENKMGLSKEKEFNAYFFFGEMDTIYKTYSQVRENNGYPSKKPKFDFFELGYEAFGALGWNTYQSSVQEDINKYLEKGFPIKWAVVGSGFWKGERRSPKEGSTTAFGIWDSIPAEKREDGLPNPRYPQVEGLKGFFKERDIKLLLGSRINFKALPADGGNYSPENDGKYVLEGLKNGYFIKNPEGKAQVFDVNFPQGKTYLLDTDKPDAVDWFVNKYSLWGVDGIKEDLMLQDGVLLGNDAKQNKVNEVLMDREQLVMVRNSAYGVPGDVLRLEDTKYGFDQDRTPINALSYAYSGVGNVYPDIVAGKYLKSPLTEDQKRYFVRNAMLAAVMPVMSMGYGPWHLDNGGYENVVKKAVDAHYSLVPYIYSEVVRGYETGFPFAMTPLPLAFPDDSNTYDLANNTKRQYSWLIGESLLATPLFGNDYAEASKRDVYLPKGKWMDWETKKVLDGGKTYTNYPFPDEKVPLFIGGKDCLVLRKDQALYCYYFPLNFKGESYRFVFPDGLSEATVHTPKAGSRSFSLTTNENTTGKLTWDEEMKAYYFEIEKGKSYQIQATE
ncbi:hypothetical protein KZP23_15315 [Echinicola marina]|uniref:TIM-barrel domain-containing protein n=1 Tax=Echinicola marina TaxID=2859768 RepID=UPI001CF68450|nr:TIM-barrel domain-containing protein [Echinicola marina]UCS92079.1 hypothetical protein KZP23_15315 [Echinicola marina]